MLSDDELLEGAARDGLFDKSRWPELLERLMPRLERIIYTEFETPAAQSMKPEPHVSMFATRTGSGSHAAEPESSPPNNVENSAPVSPAVIPDSQPDSSTTSPKALPPQLQSLFEGIKSNLTTTFPTAPPFTVQRLAELVLRPSSHYRTLPSYLRALDRIVCVSSTAETFPLPSLAATENEGSGAGILASSGGRSLADDFNGAALTRIPWLRDTASMMISSDRPLTSDLRTESTSLIDGPNGAGSVETVTVSVNGFASAARSEGHHRQESSMVGNNDAMGDASLHEDAERTFSSPDEEIEEERVHARGPEEIGVADMGPQATRSGHVFDAEAALGRPGEAETVLPSATNDDENEEDKSSVDKITSERSEADVESNEVSNPTPDNMER